ncbi:unnamed protein product [Oncorhynchus mykiss]|uniref:RING-type domain-containing protein n=1 Tax=Oncorhynchus mykiss TaxID=8022 RepID=A0A060WLW5_ONCMY|nr:unnamed protein product [Oncorhynchus mykiss]
MNTVMSPKAEDVRQGISVICEILQCPICLELMSTPVSTKCDHQFCKFCIMKLLDNSRRKEANCPVCKTKITKRSLQESPGFQKLAEGLQNMVQAYEHDTCTNYFTGMSQVRRHMSVTETVQKKNGHDVSSDDVWASDRADDEDHEFSMSCSSTIAAKDGFATLMGLEDSCPVISDEGFDSSLGDIPPATEKHTDDSKATSTTEKQKPALEAEIPEVRNQPVRRSMRNNKRESLPEMIDQNQKKSLEKVSEWLMNNSSTEVNSEKEKNTEGSYDSVSLAGSCSPSSPLEDNLRNKDQSPKREERGKCLEELVFGAVYKRDRRGNRSFSPQNIAITDPPPPCVMDDQPEMTEPQEDSPNEHPKDTEEDKKSNKKMHGRWQDVDGDLQGKVKSENNEQKKPAKKKGENIKVEKSKATKSLVLVGVGEGGSDSKMPKSRPSGQTEVQIESYPSSEDPGSPITRRTRRSRRLQLFTEEMQQSKEAKADTDRDNVAKNGCVLDEEMGGIESLDSSEKRLCEMIESQKVNQVEESIVEVPSTGSPCHADVACSVTMVPSSISTPEATSQAKCIDLDEDVRNDSELDTEQLLKSFKATKRKSFHLGSPNIKRSSFWSNKEITTLTKTQENKHVGTDMEAGNGQGFSRTTECPTAQGNRKRLRKSILTRPPQDLVDSSNPDTSGKTQKQILARLSGNSSKSALSPNKVTKSQMESPHQAVGSGLLFPAFGASKEDLPDPTPVASKQLRVPKSQQLYKVEGSMRKSPTELEKNMTGNMANTESSLTPDGLLPIIQSVVIQEAQRTKRCGSTLKRRKAQRLESSSESNCSGEEEELPSLAQIFRPSTSEDGQRASSPPMCPSPEWVTTSQASVDLFGTPEEAEGMAGDTGLTQESSQFSSECIATQQKVAMQEELRRLERMMALVSEALQEKEEEPTGAKVYPGAPYPPALLQPDRSTVSLGLDLQATLPCGQGTRKRSASREGAQNIGGNAASPPPGLGDCEGLGPTPTTPCRTKHEGPGGTGGKSTDPVATTMALN